MSIQKMKQPTSLHYQLLLSADPNQSLIDDYLPRSFCFEYLLNNACVGIIVLLPTHPKTLEIVNLAIDPSYQNQGLGHEMLHFALNFAKNKQIHTLEIGTGSTSFQQLYLYQKFGFRVTGINKNFFIHHYKEPIIENNLILKDMLRLSLEMEEVTPK